MFFLGKSGVRSCWARHICEEKWPQQIEDVNWRQEAKAPKLPWSCACWEQSKDIRTHNPDMYSFRMSGKHLAACPAPIQGVATLPMLRAEASQKHQSVGTPVQGKIGT